jgi:hypothetical protein
MRDKPKETAVSKPVMRISRTIHIGGAPSKQLIIMANPKPAGKLRESVFTSLRHLFDTKWSSGVGRHKFSR